MRQSLMLLSSALPLTWVYSVVKVKRANTNGRSRDQVNIWQGLQQWRGWCSVLTLKCSTAGGGARTPHPLILYSEPLSFVCSRQTSCSGYGRWTTQSKQRRRQGCTFDVEGFKRWTVAVVFVSLANCDGKNKLLDDNHAQLAAPRPGVVTFIPVPGWGVFQGLFVHYIIVELFGEHFISLRFELNLASATINGQQIHSSTK